MAVSKSDGKTYSGIKWKLKQFLVDGCLSYLLMDEGSRQAVLVDPLEPLIDHYRSYIGENGLKLVSALDTHPQLEHISAIYFFRDQYHVPVGMGGRTGGQSPSLLLKEGDIIRFGEAFVEVRETPGHTRDSILLLLKSPEAGSGSQALLSGNAWTVGWGKLDGALGTGSQELRASLSRLMNPLPGHTVIYPGHLHKKSDSAPLFSTVGIERKYFERWLREGEAARPSLLSERAHAEVGITVEKYAQKLTSNPEGIEFIDVREPEEYAAGHIQGTVNIPLSDLGLRLHELLEAKKIYFSCLSGRRSASATQTFEYLGYREATNVLGGYKAWVAAGLPVVSSAR